MAAAAQDRSAPRFLIDGTRGPMPAAELRQLGADWSLEALGAAHALAATDWVGLHQVDRARPAPPADHFVLLGSGDRLPIKPDTPVRLREGRLVFTPADPLEPRAGAALSLFRPYVEMFLLDLPAGVDDGEHFGVRLRAERRDTDLVLLRNGDRIEGTVTALDETNGCALLADGQAIATPWPKLAGVAFATTSLARPQPKRTHALAVLAGGARVHFASLRYDGAANAWTGRTTTGADVRLPGSALVALDLLQGRAVYLSELTPVTYTHTPYLGLSWPLGVDAAAGGGLLRVGDDCYDKGLGMHARSEAAYRLDGRFSWFEAVAGIDPAAGARGRARLAVVVDGRRYPLDAGKEQTAASAPLAVRIDVRGAQRLSLEVDFGSLGDVAARVNWGSARLLRSGG